jgi:NAD(P)-dependent dehydrogenase (short-subunit alcohol dehydrogenase family)
VKLFDLFRLDGKVALVTGGGRGVGKFIATGLAEAGADLIITSRKLKNLEAAAQELERDCGTKVLPLACNMAKEEDIRAMVQKAVEVFPKIDILINDAGATWGAPTLEFPLDKWDYVFNVNVRGVWILTQAIANIMAKSGGGNVINIASIVGMRGTEEATHPAVSYSASKAAIINLTMNLAVKLAIYNIRVNAIAPGMFLTDMMAHMEKPELKGELDNAIRTQIPLQRIGGIDDIKGVAVFLASAASSFMTGHVLVLDGGDSAK